MWGFVYILKYRIPKLYFIAILPFCTFVFNLSLICKASSGPACAEQAFTTQPLVPGEHKVGNKQLEVGKVLHLEPVLPLENVSLNNLGGERRENNMGVSWMTWGKGFWNQHCHWKNIFYAFLLCLSCPQAHKIWLGRTEKANLLLSIFHASTILWVYVHAYVKISYFSYFFFSCIPVRTCWTLRRHCLNTSPAAPLGCFNLSC